MLQGYYIYKDSGEISEEILRMANNKSGLLQAISERALSQRNLEDAFVIAPFDGRITDLQAQAHNLASQYEFFCMLVDDRSFEVAFTVLEGELARVQVGQNVTVVPLNAPVKSTTGKVQHLNPRVDEDGMVQVIASTRNSRSDLLPGMNVRVVLQQSLADQVMVPKSAVVLRQGREVIFTAKQDTAWWNYVTTGHENTRFVTIEAGIQAGDTIIVSGNLNLAHQVPIRSR
jgi:RND family efflux transporter MFP subunit